MTASAIVYFCKRQIHSNEKFVTQQSTISFIYFFQYLQLPIIAFNLVVTNSKLENEHTITSYDKNVIKLRTTL